MVDDFLRWPLPDSVCTDGCATRQGPGRVGTNLLTAIEAKQMFETVVLPKLVVKTCRACEIFGDGPCSKKAFDKMEDRVARAIHAEHNRNEGQTTPWAGLHKFQRVKYRCKAYSALKALGITKSA